MTSLLIKKKSSNTVVGRNVTVYWNIYKIKLTSIHLFLFLAEKLMNLSVSKDHLRKKASRSPQSWYVTLFYIIPLYELCIMLYWGTYFWPTSSKCRDSICWSEQMTKWESENQRALVRLTVPKCNKVLQTMLMCKVSPVVQVVVFSSRFQLTS